LHVVTLMHSAMVKCTHIMTYASAMEPNTSNVIRVSHKYHKHAQLPTSMILSKLCIHVAMDAGQCLRACQPRGRWVLALSCQFPFIGTHLQQDTSTLQRPPTHDLARATPAPRAHHGQGIMQLCPRCPRCQCSATQLC
jgi:hypothetical protein